MNTSNPALSEKVFSSAGISASQPMTLQGTINKTFYLLLFVCLSGSYTWSKAQSNPSAAIGWAVGGMIIGTIFFFITFFKPQWSAITGTGYAVAEGLVLGAVSVMYETRFHGIVLQAVMLTVGVLLAMLGLYTTRIVQPTQKFMLGVKAATGGILLVYIATWVLGFFHIEIPYIHGSGLVGIGFSVFVVIIAALNLIINFGIIEHGVANRAPKYMEWYSGFGLLVTLVWLYLEILTLLSKLASRRD